MAKNKVKKEVVENDYFYEVCGFTIIILCIVTLGELGRFGSLILLLLKILIGDYAFLLVSILLIVGVRCLIKKKLINVKSLSFQGFVLIFLALGLLSHLAIYNALNLRSNQVFTSSLRLYQNYLKNHEKGFIFGGGIIGAALFQIIIILLGEIGIILISIAFLILGCSFFFNTKIIDMLINGKRFSTFLRKFIFGSKNYFKNLKYKEKTKTFKDTPKNVNLNLLTDINTTPNNLQVEINKEVVENLKEYINQNNMFASYETFYTSYGYSRYTLDLINNSTYKLLREKINYFFDNKCFYIKNNLKINIEVPNTFKELLTLKRLLCIENKIDVTLGLEIDGSLIKIDFLKDQNLVMCGDYNSGIRTSIKSLIINILMVHKEDVSFEFLDSKQEFMELSNLSDMINYYLSDPEGLSLLENLALEYERRKEILNYLNTDNYIECNKEIKIGYPNIKQIKPIYVFINTNLFKGNIELENKLNYLLKFSYKMGIFFTIVVRRKEDFNRLNISNNAYMGFYSSDLELSLRITNSDILCCLNKKGDFIYVNQDIVKHAQAPFISSNDYLNVLKKLI